MAGWLQPGEGSGEIDADPDDDVLPQVRMADVVQHVDQDLYGGYPWSTPTPPGRGGRGRPPTWEQLPEVSATTGLKNFLYAVEWWIFGAVRRVHLVAVGARAGRAGPPGSPSRVPDDGPVRLSAVTKLFHRLPRARVRRRRPARVLRAGRAAR